jgi:hypothetical protein
MERVHDACHVEGLRPPHPKNNQTPRHGPKPRWRRPAEEGRGFGGDGDLPLNFHPAAIRASACFGLLPIVGRPEGRVFRPLLHRRAGCAGVSHEGSRGLVADCPMRSILVVVLAPILQLFAGVGKGQEPVRVQALGAQAAVEGLDKGVDAPMSVKSWLRPLRLGGVDEFDQAKACGEAYD